MNMSLKEGRRGLARIDGWEDITSGEGLIEAVTNSDRKNIEEAGEYRIRTKIISFRERKKISGEDAAKLLSRLDKFRERRSR